MQSIRHPRLNAAKVRKYTSYKMFKDLDRLVKSGASSARILAFVMTAIDDRSGWHSAKQANYADDALQLVIAEGNDSQFP